MDELKLGAFSISLAVQDINASLAFYEKLGFSVMGGWGIRSKFENTKNLKFENDKNSKIRK